MRQTIQLSETEKSRLERILSLQDVERQKRIAYPFWALALIFFLVAQVALFMDILWFIIMLPLSLVPLMIGMALFGYYKLFRLLHHQNAVIEQLQQASQCDG